ncbi:HNH endonuclease [Peribacillus simplex]|uniref:HNH endonuclease n=1 Tax=Peribacillus simplex TaxID=1478 RepID=UPI0024C1F0F4|nr:HNH endonuclease [Peribacillus simplex]WHX92012.1 HNH endonuclease [Peribacillus simplex]
MKKTLEIAGLEFVKVGAGYKNEKFYNEETNNLIVFRPYDGLNTENVLNQMVDAPMDYIDGLLTESENNVVILSAIETTTSDFRAYCDLGAEKVKELALSKHNKIVKFLDNVINNASGEKTYKHTAIFEGEVHAVEINQTVKTIAKDSQPEAELFKGTENGYVIAHINGNIVDNRAVNLQWVKVC